MNSDYALAACGELPPGFGSSALLIIILIPEYKQYSL